MREGGKTERGGLERSKYDRRGGITWKGITLREDRPILLVPQEPHFTISSHLKYA